MYFVSKVLLRRKRLMYFVEAKKEKPPGLTFYGNKDQVPIFPDWQIGSAEKINQSESEQEPPFAKLEKLPEEPLW